MKIIIFILSLTSFVLACDPYKTAVKKVKEEANSRKAEKVLTAGGGGKSGGIHVLTFLLLLPKNENLIATIQVDEANCKIVADSFMKPWEVE